MTSPVLTMPDDPTALPHWLEGELLGPRLGRLVAELDAVHRPTTDPLLDDVLGDRAPAVLAAGLSALTRPAVGLLLRHPTLLPDLRDRVLTDGGAYWDRYLSDSDIAAGRVSVKVRAAIAPAEPARRRGQRWAGYAATAAATAAAVLAAVYALGGFRPPAPIADQRASEIVQIPPAPTTPPPGWGFARVAAIPPGNDAATLTALADLVAEWGKKPPRDEIELARRLVEFRQGCAAIQLADDIPLSESNRRWLRLRCADWAADVDAHLRELEATRDATAVRAAADATADRIAREFRGRAAEGGAG